MPEVPVTEQQRTPREVLVEATRQRLIKKHKQAIKCGDTVTQASALAEALRTAEIIRTRLEGTSIEDISQKFDISRQRTSLIINNYFKEVWTELTTNLDTLRAQEVARLDHILSKIFPRLEGGLDDKAIASYMLIAKRRAALLGLDVVTPAGPNAHGDRFPPALSDADRALRLADLIESVRNRSNNLEPAPIVRLPETVEQDPSPPDQ